MSDIRNFEVDLSKSGVRLDVFLSDENRDLSRTYVKSLISDGMVRVNGIQVKANYKLKSGDRIIVIVPPPVVLEVKPEPIPLEIYYEDRDLLVVNKPRGMVVHPAEGNYTGTLVNALLYNCKDLSGINGVIRPGIVHRLDKDTSGLLMVAKNDQIHRDLAGQLKDRLVNRRYIALAHGNVKENSGTVDAPLGRDPNNRQRMAVVERGGRHAVTNYTVQERFGQYTLLELSLQTGRTHQIRVHMAYIRHPLVGDPKYGPERAHFHLDGQFLHAFLLGFHHPRLDKYMEFRAPLPPQLVTILDKLKREAGPDK